MPLNYNTLATSTTAFAWHTNIAGLNDDNSFSNTPTTGIADGTIKDIKSYSFTTSTAPDYYNYIAYSASTSVPCDHIQIRTNDWRNTCVLSATNLGSSTPQFRSISAIDVINNQLFILDSGIVYKANLNINNAVSSSNLISVQKIGSNTTGDINDKNNFNTPTDIRACNGLLYVCDSFNSCVKVYNTALSWVNTIHVAQLSAYTVQHVEVNPVSNNVYILAKTFAPVAPILTNVTTVTSTSTFAVYNVSWVHDGSRLINNTINSLSAFSLYGLPTAGQSYVMLTSAALVSASMSTYNGSILGQTQSVTYRAASGITYSNFALQALGNNSFNSEFSNVVPTPNNYYFNSPYRVFEINSSNQLVNSFALPSNTNHISPQGNIQSTTNIKKMVIDPTGVFLYFITDSYIYKYLSNGIALVRLSDPSKTSLGDIESLKSAFIDNRLNFFIATDKRIFKYIDIPNTLNLYNAETIDMLMIPLSSIEINSNEFIQDWVYNKSILRLLQNHEILYKSIRGKYNINLDSNGNLLPGVNSSFNIAGLRSTDIATPFTIDQNYFIHSNELVTSAVVNRILTNIYNLQVSMLKLVSPIINKQLPKV